MTVVSAPHRTWRRENDDAELDRFRTEINLPDFAQSRGYQIDRQKSTRRYLVLKHGEGDKIVVTRQANGHWTYFSPSDSQDKGSIVDFLQHRERLNLGEVRRELRGWPNMGQTSLLDREAEDIEKKREQLRSIAADWIDAKEIEPTHAFLIARGVGPAFTDRRFSGTARLGKHYDVLFSYCDADGNVLGIEKRNHAFKGFSAGGTRGLWRSNEEDSDSALVICESPLDCLAFHLLRPSENVRYAATGGSVSTRQIEILSRVLVDRPNLEIIIATDADEGGERIAAQISRSVRPLS